MQQLSIWEAESFFAPQDFIVVGGGFSGLWTALHLKEKFPSKKITILERGTIPFGASGRNAGFACFGSPTEILYDMQNMGQEKTLQLIHQRFMGLKMIRDYFDDNTIDYTNCGGYELLNNEDVLNDLKSINQLLSPITSAPETFVPANKFLKKSGFAKVSHLVENKFEGALHPGKLLRSLIELATGNGVSIINNAEVVHFEETPRAIILHTASRLKLKQPIAFFARTPLPNNYCRKLM